MNVYLWFLAAVIPVLLIIQLVYQVSIFRGNLSYIRVEIRRNEGEERAYWKKEEKRLWMSLIPFYNPYRSRHH